MPHVTEKKNASSFQLYSKICSLKEEIEQIAGTYSLEFLALPDQFLWKGFIP